jgi:hypothetical protein
LETSNRPATQQAPPSAAAAEAASGFGRGVFRRRLVLRRPIGRAPWRATLRRGAAPGGPVALVAVVLALTAAGYLADRRYPWPLGFVDIGARFASRIGAQGLAVSETGYDGQFVYYLATRPQLILTCAHNLATCPLDDPLERIERIFYPFSAWLLSFGQPGLVPYALFLINLVAILVTVALVGQVCVELGASRWLGAAAGLYWGQALGLVQDVADPYATLWVVVAVWCLRRGRPRWGATAAGAALLTREQLLLFLPLLFLPLLAQHRWLIVAQSALLAGAPFFGWQGMLRLLYGKWPLTDSVASAPIWPFPFAGLWHDRSGPLFPTIVLFVAVPVVVAAIVAVAALWRHGLRSLPIEPLPLVAALYCLLISLTSAYQWNEMFSPSRLAAPGIVLGVLVAPWVARPLRAAYVVLLAASGTVLLLAYLAAVLR